jgi:hypothetical protein
MKTETAGSVLLAIIAPGIVPSCYAYKINDLIGTASGSAWAWSHLEHGEDPAVSW